MKEEHKEHKVVQVDEQVDVPERADVWWAGCDSWSYATTLAPAITRVKVIMHAEGFEMPDDGDGWFILFYFDDR